MNAINDINGLKKTPYLTTLDKIPEKIMLGHLMQVDLVIMLLQQCPHHTGWVSMECPSLGGFSWL